MSEVISSFKSWITGVCSPYVVCIDGRRFVCCRECNVVSNECNEPTFCASEVHPVFNPVAPYGYLLPNMYLFIADHKSGLVYLWCSVCTCTFVIQNNFNPMQESHYM